MKQRTTEGYIQEVKKVHGDKYDYSKVEYINSSTKVCIICPKHGEFWQRPHDHLYGRGCSECNGTKKYTTSTIIDRFKEKYDNKYDYSKVEYVNTKTKVCIICHEKDILGKEHGEFWIRPNDFLQGYSCPKCNNEYKPTTEEWVERAAFVHNNEFDYSKVKYINANTKVCIICPKHGEFWQTPLNHIHNKCKCPKCNSYKKSLLERKVSELLTINGLEFEGQKTFDWLKHQRNLILDFYLPKHKIAIECQGEQHFHSIEKFGGEKEFKKILERDIVKKTLCEEHNIKIFYIRRNDISINKIIQYINETANKEE